MAKFSPWKFRPLLEPIRLYSARKPPNFMHLRGNLAFHILVAKLRFQSASLIIGEQVYHAAVTRAFLFKSIGKHETCAYIYTGCYGVSLFAKEKSISIGLLRLKGNWDALCTTLHTRSCPKQQRDAS